MASLGGNMTPTDVDRKLLFAGLAVLLSAAVGLVRRIWRSATKDASHATDADDAPGLARSLLLFCYSCFLKPHSGDGGGSDASQQDALESFYKAQAGVYDVTRKALLKGREDMLALVAAQLVHRQQVIVDAAEAAGDSLPRPAAPRVWVDVGGGTGWNIEAMAAYVDVPVFFSAVYLVDFSPSLCAVARRRFARLGWANVHVVCTDARRFRLADYEAAVPGTIVGADLITMSYSLSMIPDYYSVVDSLASLLAPDGILGAIDFYVQSQADFGFRNFTGGLANRHVGFLGRAFWRSWFELDRVSLDAGRRDYLEYRFGTVLSVNGRNASLGRIPYYIWVGCAKAPFHATSLPHEVIERIDAMVTESSSPSAASSPSRRTETPASPATTLSRAVQRSAPEIRSKAFQTAVANLSAGLPLPAFFYQNHAWRIYYDDQLPKHTQFGDAYIYAFTWEDARVDERLLRLGPRDVVLAITSAGDNVLSYALQSPARIHAVDLNPAQNHLLELKVAAYAARLPYDDFWRLFGLGRHPAFRALLLERLSPHLSSRAFQYWLQRTYVFEAAPAATTLGGLTGLAGPGGLYDTGGSRNALRLMRALAALLGLRGAVRQMLAAPTLNEQREIWHARLRPALLSRLLSHLVVSQERFLWAALGVPKNQLAMIEADHARSDAAAASPSASRAGAVWAYMVNTLDPVVEHVHLARDNPYYYVCLDGQYAPRCHPDYLDPAAHARLSQPAALDGLRIHTDEIDEVIARLAPGSLTVAVIMDSMDWFDPEAPGAADAAQAKTAPSGHCPSSATGARAAAAQITKLNRALALGGRVLLRSSARSPWYLAVFERLGFTAQQHGDRAPGTCIDRVNMYASCWICTKVAHLPPPTPPTPGPEGVADGHASVGAGVGDIDKLVL